MGILDLIPGVSAIKAILTPLDSITRSITEWQVKKNDAKTEQERIYADENIKVLSLRRDIMVAEGAHSKINQIVRAGLAFPVVFLVNKLIIYDIALGQWTQGVTDRIDDKVWQIIYSVIGFYLVDNIRQSWMASRVAKR